MNFLTSLTDLPAHTMLPNGIRVFFRKTLPSGLASVQVWVKSGSLHEGEFLGGGISHYLEHMLFKGTEKFSSEEISRKVSALGGSMNAYTTFSRTVYHIDLPAESCESAFEILAQMVLAPRLAEEDALSEKDVILREIDMCDDDPDSRLSEATLAEAYRVHPLRFPIIGKREIFSRLNSSDLKTYFEKRYTSDTINLVVAGDLDEAIVFTLAEKYFGGATTKATPEAFVPAEPAQLAPREVTLYGDVKILRGNLIWKIPGLTHPDAPALSVLAALLGKGDSALLWNELHEKRGLVHALSASVWTPANEGMFWISYAADLDKRQSVEDALREEISKIKRDGIAPSLLKKASRQALVGLVNSRRTVASSAASLGREAVEVGELGATAVFLERIRALTPDSVCESAEKYLREECSTVAAYEKKLSRKTLSESSGKNAASHAGTANFESVRLPNGVRILLQPVKGFPKFYLQASLRAGGIFETHATKGASALLATMLTLDAGTRKAAEIAEVVESVGGSFEEDVDANSISLAIETLSDDCSLACEILRDALLEPHFTEENFERERSAQLAALRSEYDEIEYFARIALRERFYGKECPLGTHIFGTEKSLETQTLSDIQSLYEKVVVPENLVIAASGEFDREQLLKMLTDAFGSFCGKREFVIPKMPSPIEAERAREEQLAFDGEQAIVQLAFPDVGACDERRFVSALTAGLLSGMSSRLFLEVREKRGLAYFIGASRGGSPEFGMFTLCAGTEKSKTEAVFAEMRKEMERLRRGEISDDELRATKMRMCISRRSARQRASVRAGTVLRESLYQIPILSENEFERRINEVSRDDIARFAREILAPEKSLALIVA